MLPLTRRRPINSCMLCFCLRKNIDSSLFWLNHLATPAFPEDCRDIVFGANARRTTFTFPLDAPASRRFRFQLKQTRQRRFCLSAVWLNIYSPRGNVKRDKSQTKQNEKSLSTIKLPAMIEQRHRRREEVTKMLRCYTIVFHNKP